MTRNKSGIRSFFSSVQLAIVLLSLIAFLAVIGTLVSRREAAVELAARLSPGLFGFLQKMQIFDLYHSIWLFLLMALLALIVCSLDRFPMTWRRFRLRPSQRSEDVFKNLQEENSFQTTVEAQKAANIAADLLQKRFRHFERTDEPASSFFYAEKGRFSYFGVYIVHLSLLVLIAGSIIVAIFGMEESVNIIEGESVNAINLRNGN